MSIYFCINEVLDILEKIDDEQIRKKALIPVSLSEPEHVMHQEDIFTLSSSPKLLDLNHGDAPFYMANLMDEVPLYHVNTELILDGILAERHQDSLVLKAITTAFSGEDLPETMAEEIIQDGDDITANLLHPVIGYMDKLKLCKIYLSFLNELKQGQYAYSFEKRILGKQVDAFLNHFEGFISGYEGKVKADILIGFGIRQDHELKKKTGP